MERRVSTVGEDAPRKVLARVKGWSVIEYPVSNSQATKGYHVAQCSGTYDQKHYGIIKDLTQPCTICKVMAAQRQKCAQHVYVEGRKTFEFVCPREHHYLASSYKKGPDYCPMCEMEDETYKLGRTITFDSGCTYVGPETHLRYYCQSCEADHYITFAIWKKLFGTDGKRRKQFKSVIDWCQRGKHAIPEGPFNEITLVRSIFEQIFDARFDDCDDMIAANNKVLSGIYFSGFNRELKIAFLHTRDPCFHEENRPLVDWCVRWGIRLIVVKASQLTRTAQVLNYNDPLTQICTGIATLNIATRFDAVIPPQVMSTGSSKNSGHTERGDSVIRIENTCNAAPIENNLTVVDSKTWRSKQLLSCVLVEGRKEIKCRVICRKKK